MTFRHCGPGWSLQGQDHERGRADPRTHHSLPRLSIRRVFKLLSMGKSSTAQGSVQGQSCWIPCLGADLCRAPCYCSCFSSIKQKPPPPPSASLKQRGFWQHRSPGLLQQTALSPPVTAGGTKQWAETLCYPQISGRAPRGFLAYRVNYAPSQPPINLGALILSKELEFENSRARYVILSWLLK